MTRVSWPSFPDFAFARVTDCPTGVDFVQEKFLGAGPQDNEVRRHHRTLVPRYTNTNMSQSAVEQAKDEQISDYIRSTYKSSTGSDIPIKDKETRFG